MKQVYAQAMKFFIIFTLLAFLAVMFYLDILRYIIGPDYWPGLRALKPGEYPDRPCGHPPARV